MRTTLLPEPRPWWQFWHPGSGIVGSLISAVVIFSVFFGRHHFTPDAINGLFEAGGALVLWQNVKRIRRDKMVRGIDSRVTGFFFAWGTWNLWYYPHLHQWLSFTGGLAIVTINGVWLYYAIRYRNA